MFSGSKLSLQIKVLTLIISLIMFIIVLLNGVYALLELKQTEQQKGQLALQTAKAVSFMPDVQGAFLSKPLETDIQPIVEQMRQQAGAAAIIVENREGKVLAASDPELIGQRGEEQENFKALVYAGYYLFENDLFLKGKAPIIVEKGHYRQVVGTVSVEYSKKELNQEIMNHLTKMLLFSAFVLVAGVIGGILLTRSIRKDTLGLEPNEIASLFRERNAILSSIKEGIIAIDRDGILTMANPSAFEILGLSTSDLSRRVEEVLPSSTITRVLKSGLTEVNQEVFFNDKVLIVNRIPVWEKGEIIGVVSSFRDKTDIKRMVDTISEVRKYSEDLRAQTHEFQNKLYVLLGLLQLGHYDEAITMIQEEARTNEAHNSINFNQIRDPKVQAILLGKLGKASEKKVHFVIDSNSSLMLLPPHFKISQLITIAGNLIDNAFEEVANQRERDVSFFITDMGNDIVMEVADNGRGISNDQIDKLFNKGFSTKGENRGYGLANVKEEVDSLGGYIEVNNPKTGGTVFTVILPKASQIQREEER